MSDLGGAMQPRPGIEAGGGLAAHRRRLDDPEAAAADALARFAATAAVPADEDAPEGDAAILRELASARVSRLGQVVHSSNAVFLVELDASDPFDSAQPLRGIYKPLRGERPLWDFPAGSLHLREIGAYLAAAALGLDMVPPTVARDGPLGPGSLQLFIEVAELGGRGIEELDPTVLDRELRTIAALDVLLNNADRKSAHLLITPRGVRAIDNALSFLPYPRQRTVLLELGGSPLPRSVAATIVGFASDTHRRASLHRRLGRLLDVDEMATFFQRLDDLATRPMYPLLHPWDGRPFEWW